MKSQHQVLRAGVALLSAATFAGAAAGTAWAHGPGNHNAKHGHPNHGHGH